MRGLRVHITGVVQGVGFRPFVHNLANRYKLNGWVRNTTAGVDIELDGEPQVLEEFIHSLQAEIPPLARVDEFSTSFGPPSGFSRFEILHSESITAAFQPISADFATCDDCLRDISDPQDRRFRYPFTNCTNCGPRFTIIQDIPYDRLLTTMAGFKMCTDCEREYRDPSNRRFHAQPIACPVCGPRVWLENSTATGAKRIDIAAGGDPIRQARSLLGQGSILAIKGLGGFHLACDAENAPAVIELRERKNRVDKPFALMLPDLAAVERHCLLDDSERELLRSSAKPIVLLRRRLGSRICAEVAPGQDQLGIMLPYTPLHYLLFAERGDPDQHFPSALVMTSGNMAEEPIATDNEESRQRLAPLADAFLMHDREIYIRCDDSVMRVIEDPEESGARNEEDSSETRNGNSKKKQKPDLGSQTPFRKSIYPLRRSRGYSPFPVRLPWNPPPLLAVGAELKNTFCITNGNYAFLSQHIGDMENYETLRSFEHSVRHFEQLFRVQPEALAYDLHPDYLASRYALERGRRDSLPTLAVQHHHAHIAACMTEHGFEAAHPVIGIAFDGTGYGEDGAIWGGEFLVADYKEYRRAAHLDYFPLPGGDAAIKKPARSALALLWSLGLDWDERLAPVMEYPGLERVNLRIQLERRVNAPLTSSIGRLFDAAAALAGVRQEVNYEAQAAIEFEAVADPDEPGIYPFDVDASKLLVRQVITSLVSDVFSGTPISIISARFHNGLAAGLRSVVMGIKAETGLNEVVLSGGVWQNITLLRRTLSLLRQDGFVVYIHREVPTNDGGLSLGQAVIAAQRIMA